MEASIAEGTLSNRVQYCRNVGEDMASECGRELIISLDLVLKARSKMSTNRANGPGNRVVPKMSEIACSRNLSQRHQGWQPTEEVSVCQKAWEYRTLFMASLDMMIAFGVVRPKVIADVLEYAWMIIAALSEPSGYCRIYHARFPSAFDRKSCGSTDTLDETGNISHWSSWMNLGSRNIGEHIWEEGGGRYQLRSFLGAANFWILSNSRVELQTQFGEPITMTAIAWVGGAVSPWWTSSGKTVRAEQDMPVTVVDYGLQLSIGRVFRVVGAQMFIVLLKKE